MSFATDIRNAFRTLLGSPLFVSLAVASLALGIGVNAAIFSLFDQMLLRPLAVTEPDRLVNLRSPGPKPGSTSNNIAGPREDIFSYPMYRDLRGRSDTVAKIAAHRSFPANVAFEDSTVSGRAMLVSDNYFDALRLQPALGRLITAGDERAPGEPRLVVLAHGYWQNRLGADPDVIGRSLRVNGQSLNVIGVGPAGFSGTTLGGGAEVFVPISLADLLQPDRPAQLEDRRNYWVYLFGRLDAGQTPQSAEAMLQPVYRNLLREIELPLQSGLDDADKAEFAAKPLQLLDGHQGQSSIRVSSATGLTVMLLVSVLVLVVACLNVANLQLARGTQRSGEVALRAAVGAGRPRLLRQLMTESLLLALLGGLLAMPVAQLVLFGLADLLPSTAAHALNFSPDQRVFAVAMLAALASVLLFGMLPALQLSRTAPMEALRQSATHSIHPLAARFRALLAVAQVTLSTASLILAGLFTQSLDNILQSEPGMQIDHVVSFSLAPRRNGYDDARSEQFVDQLEQRLAGLPGVVSASTTLVPLLSGSDWSSNISVQGVDNSDPAANHAHFNVIGAGYFETLGMGLLAGRAFNAADAKDRPRVAIVNRAFAEHFKLGADVIGTRMAIGEKDELGIEIVGLVETVSYDDIRRRDQVQFYRPRQQADASGETYFILKTRGHPGAVLSAIPDLVAEFDANLPVQDLGTLEQQVLDTLATEAMVGTLSRAFAVLATALAALGLYGVINYTLNQRLREFGLRLALGAEPGRIRALVLRQSLRLFVTGAALGSALGIAVGRAAESLLFGLAGHDPQNLLIALVLLGTVAALASWLPARRATQVDPMAALRYS